MNTVESIQAADAEAGKRVYDAETIREAVENARRRARSGEKNAAASNTEKAVG